MKQKPRYSLKAAEDAESQLAPMGLEPWIFSEAVEKGEGACRECSPWDAKYFPRVAAQSRTLRSLREILVPRGWLADVTPQGLDYVESPDGSIRIVVQNGDAGTGNPAREPKTRSKKGPATEAAVANNMRGEQLLLFTPAEMTELAIPLPTASVAVWFLLFYATKDEIRCELSRPLKFEGGSPSDWQERIFLAPVPIGGEPIIRPADGEPDVEVEVFPKTPPVSLEEDRNSA